ncbi:MAG: hypothetical protein FWB90_02855 [Fibromonadales bacterium]|nr:hypothetical protein [Fibromonadales bacterium]
MPFKGNWKKPFEAAIKAVADSKSATLKELSVQTLLFARTDSIIYGATKVKPSRTGGTYKLYLETPQMDRYTNPKGKNNRPRRIFNNAKFVNRTGNLAKAFTPAGNWSGDHLQTRGEGEVNIIANEKEALAVFRFTGEAEGALRGGDAKKGRNSKIDISDKDGNVIATQNERGRRRVMENAGNKVKRFFAKIMKKNLDMKTRSVA